MTARGLKAGFWALDVSCEAEVSRVIPHLDRNSGGGIINLSSKIDALIYAPDKIRVNSIHPGFIWTPMVEGFLQGKGDVGEGRRATDTLHPLGHVGEPGDMAWGCVYLASDKAKFVTGAMVIFAITWLSLRWMRLRTEGEALITRVIWVALTVLFKLGLGRMLGFRSARILSDFDLSRGGLMVLSLTIMGLSPWIAHKLQSHRHA